MLKILSALKARQNLGQVMNEVSLKGDDYVIERAGKPLVAIVSMEKYRILQKEREETLRTLDNVWGKMEGEKPATVERTINEAVKSVRKIK
ncbi:MAG: type II toxin-antitoxin system Phd/YefM family antitoxin [Candidatus Latescibacteria bacterium]|nr:type II toxin-antitoxin system Phd/YefM family antitoxin [Candidatus Latescibacterota bacterium]